MIKAISIATLVTALVTGGITYFAAKPTTHQHEEKTQLNNVTIEEKVDMVAIVSVTLLLILLIVKFVEFSIVTISSYKRAMKKKYTRAIPLTSVITVPPNQNQQNQPDNQ